MPIIEIKSAGIIGKPRAITIDHRALAHLKADKFKVQRVQATADLGQAEAMLFNVK